MNSEWVYIRFGPWYFYGFKIEKGIRTSVSHVMFSFCTNCLKQSQNIIYLVLMYLDVCISIRSNAILLELCMIALS